MLKRQMCALIVAAALLTAMWAWAASEKVTETEDTAYYVDVASTTDTGGVRRVTVIQDYAKEQPAGVRSRRVDYEIDCSNQRLRSVAVVEYAERMARGTAGNSWQRESDWLYVTATTGTNIPRATPYRPIVQFVCSR